MINIIQGDSFKKLKEEDENSFDSCVTDPPYELGFMNKKWDESGIAFNVDFWKEVKRVLKPGSYLLSFGGTRTHHRMMVAIEDAGFEIRDTLMWVYGGGFPKNHDISKAIDEHLGEKQKKVGLKPNATRKDGSMVDRDCYGGEWTDTPSGWQERGRDPYKREPTTDEAKKWDGWGTALKPGYEPIVLARKPLDGTYAENTLKHGVGGLNIDDCRIEADDPPKNVTTGQGFSEGKFMGNQGKGEGTIQEEEWEMPDEGRWPGNLILDERASAMLDEQSGKSSSNIRKPTGGEILDPDDGWNENNMEDRTVRGYEDKGGASRFFYCPKANGDNDRHLGVENNDHPTVKPIELVSYLIRLVTPKGGNVLDPFAGSGTTGISAQLENVSCTLIEKSKESVKIAKERNEYVRKNYSEVKRDLYEDPSNSLTEEQTEVNEHSFW